MATINVRAPFFSIQRDPDSLESRARQFMEDIGPAMSEDEHQLRRGMAGYICEHVYNRDFSGLIVRVNPRSGDLAEDERTRIETAMQSAIGRCELTVSATCDPATRILHVDIEPRTWPGHSWEVEARERAADEAIRHYLATRTIYDEQD